ncbi:hypothetical protein [Clostridium sp. UBA1056]|uniref:hypothetical protein n=1 Tax=unclassified Clostridium TaxID=2614128 RepID=UPI003216FA15
MENIKANFDDFTLNARVMPVLVVVLPIICVGLYESIIKEGVLESTIYASIIIIFITFMAYIARDLGKKAERKMVKRLGGLPTTILMRFSDTRIDPHSKMRYHKILKKKIKGLNIPISIEEEKDDSDYIYDSAINWIRGITNSDKKKYHLVYKELKNYNFWRNLYGIKYIGICIYILIAIREIVLMSNFDIVDIFMKPYPQYIAFIIMTGSALLGLIMINKKIVENKAFDYAKALLEICDKI